MRLFEYYAIDERRWEGEWKRKMTKGIGSGKVRNRTRLFGDIKKHKAVTQYHKGKCISVAMYEIKGSNVDRYLGTVEFEHKYAGLINSIISQSVMPYGVAYDVFLKTAKDRRYVMVCVSLNSDYEDIGIKNCFNLCRKLIDMIMRQIEHEARYGEEDNGVFAISDRMDEIKTNINTFVRFEVDNAYHRENEQKDKDKGDMNEIVKDIKKKVIDELMDNLKKLKKKI